MSDAFGGKVFASEDSKTVYCTAPRTMYASTTYDEMVQIAEELFPSNLMEDEDGDLWGEETTVIESREVFKGGSASDWEHDWPRIRDEADGLVFITDEEGFIGSGVYREIQDLKRRGKPVFLALAGERRQGRLFTNRKDGGMAAESLDGIHIEIVDGGKDWKRYARVSLK